MILLDVLFRCAMNSRGRGSEVDTQSLKTLQYILYRLRVIELSWKRHLDQNDSRLGSLSQITFGDLIAVLNGVFELLAQLTMIP